MERLTRMALAAPSVTLLVGLILLGFGVAAAMSLNQELIPDMDFPQATVITVWPGATAEQVTQDVVKPIEKALATMKGIPVVEVSASASEGFAYATVRAEYGTRQDELRAAVEDALKDVELPADVQAPRLLLFNFSDIPVARIAVSGALEPVELERLVREEIIPELEAVDGVAAVSLVGGNPERIAITLDAAKLRQAGVSLSAIRSMLQANNIVFPAGSIQGDGRTLLVQAGHRIDSLDKLRTLPLLPAGSASGAGGGVGGRSPAMGMSAVPGDGGSAATSEGASAAAGEAPGEVAGAGEAPGDMTAAVAPLALGDVATIERTPGEVETLSRLDGEPALSLLVAKEQQANTVAVVNAVLDEIEVLSDKDKLRQLEFTTVFEQASYIEESLRGVAREGLLGAVFAILAILAFLSFSVRSTLVTAISIPLSVCIGFLFLRLSGQTLNLLTLSGLTVAIGRVVDDSIVVLENIYRHLQRGERRLQAIIDGTRQVSTAIFASTLVTIAVFLPLGFVGGITRQFFLPFALTTSYALAASILVAVTVVPVLARLFLSTAVLPKERESRLVQLYCRTLSWALAHRGMTLGLAFLFFLGSLFMLRFLPQTFLPSFGPPAVNVAVELEPGSSLERTDEVARVIETALLDNEEVESVLTTVGTGGNGGEAFFGLAAGLDSAKASLYVDLVDDFDGDLNRLTGRLREDLDLWFEGEPITITVGSGGLAGPMSSTFDLELRGDDEAALREANEAVLAALRDPDNWTDYDKVPLVNLESNLTAARSVIAVDVDPQRALRYGLTAAQVGLALRESFEAQELGTVTLGEGDQAELLSVELRPPPSTVASIDALRGFPIAGPAGSVLLGDIATVEERPGLVTITRIDGERAALITGGVEADDTFGVFATADRIVDDLELPEGVEVGPGVESRIQRQAFGDTVNAILISVVIVYLIMAVIFGSLVHPFTILFSLPFAVSGALIALAVTGRPLSISGLVGMLMLVGIVITNAIVLIDLVQQHRRQGLDAHQALLAGGRTRLRPILMTALATLLALIPLAMGLTEGAIIAAELATVVIGGLFTSTLLTLVIVPVVYSLLDGLASRPVFVPTGPAAGLGPGEVVPPAGSPYEGMGPGKPMPATGSPYEGMGPGEVVPPAGSPYEGMGPGEPMPATGSPYEGLGRSS